MSLSLCGFTQTSYCLSFDLEPTSIMSGSLSLCHQYASPTWCLCTEITFKLLLLLLLLLLLVVVVVVVVVVVFSA
jgi:peptidoglycan/LPS O-acetylase OafA/YrhL